MDHADKALHDVPASEGGAGVPGAVPPKSTEMAVAAAPDINFALISTPGEYAAAEAMKALQLGLHVMLFSDNVTLEDEVALKQLGRDRDLLVMGPDCGTAIINGVPLAFANVVRRGKIGCIGASGTGLQQVTCLIDRQGAGISQAIGTGSHDLHKSVGGITTLQGIAALGGDPDTTVLVLISKPPAPEVAQKVLAAANKIGKPVVVNFIGADPASIKGKNLYPVTTLEEAAAAAVALSRGRKPARRRSVPTRTAFVRLAAGQRYIRGLYSGGTFCYEATLLLGRMLGKTGARVWSNAPVNKDDALTDIWHSREHTIIDLGDDVFTRGRPHPMIDHRLRNERLLIEADDAEVAVILFDVVLGYGSHPDPAGEVVTAVRAARARNATKKRQIAFVGFVCGTPGDPQDLTKQEATLRAVGVELAPSNAAAVRMAAAIVARTNAARPTRKQGAKR
jgi:succinyl-CoA synthetase alpha subunit